MQKRSRQACMSVSEPVGGVPIAVDGWPRDLFRSKGCAEELARKNGRRECSGLYSRAGRRRMVAAREVRSFNSN